MFHTTSLIKELRVLQLQRGITYPKAVNNQPLNDLYSHFIIYFSLFPTRYTVFPSTYNICHPLSSTCFRPHRPIIRRSKLYMQPMVFSPSADVFVVRPLRKDSLNGRTTKTSAEGENTIGCLYNLDLLMMGL